MLNLNQISLRRAILLAFLNLHVVVNCINAQNSSKVSFKTEFSTLASVGIETRQTIEYEPGLTLDFPKISNYNGLVYRLEFGPDYEIFHNFKLGMTGGIAVIQGESNPLVSGDFFNRVMFPVIGNLEYHLQFGNGFSFVPKLKFGYQFSEDYFGHTEEGYLYEQHGRMIAGVDLGLMKRVGKYAFYLNLGYELQQMQNEVSLAWINGHKFEDKFKFITSTNCLKIGIGIRY